MLQPLKQLGALVELLPEALGHIVIHFTVPQQIFERSDQVGQVLSVSSTNVVALVDFRVLAGLLGKQRADGGSSPTKRKQQLQPSFLKLPFIWLGKFLGPPAHS